MMVRPAHAALLFLFLLTSSVPSIAASQPPPAQEQFLPISEIPPSEQLPGGAFVVIAYSFVWIATMMYVWFVWRRLRKVEEEMRSLQRSGATGNTAR
jgi:CcmD family protein